MKPVALLAALAVLSSASGCSPAPPAASPIATAQEVGEIVRTVELTAQGWNRRDLDAFLAPYAEDATFVVRDRVLRGKPAIRAEYKVSDFDTDRVLGTQRYEGIEVRMLGPRNALVVGRYVVTKRGREADETGLFSLTLERRAEGWRIIHEHSSEPEALRR
jgi:uncharacterized protein (TIGR02246 family)